MENKITVKKIAIVGPESTGKSWFAKKLAAHYNTVFVKEFARTYLENLNRPYTFSDLKTIAIGQMQAEDEQLRIANRFLFCDTNLLVIKVWSDFKYNKTDSEITDELKKRKYDLHLLCNIDLPWQDDPLREHPHAREKLFGIYKEELGKLAVDYKIISGLHTQRFYNAVNILDKWNAASSNT